MRLFLVLTGVAVAALQGCGGMLNTASNEDFACPGMPGVICKSPSEVYKLSDGQLPPWQPADADGGVKSMSRAPTGSAAPMPAAGRHDLQPVTGAPAPLREPARVMRVWIAPWVDRATDNLYWPSYIYTEITPRRWSFGRPEFANMKPSAPTAPTAPLISRRAARGEVAASATQARAVPQPAPQAPAALWGD